MTSRTARNPRDGHEVVFPAFLAVRDPHGPRTVRFEGDQEPEEGPDGVWLRLVYADEYQTHEIEFLEHCPARDAAARPCPGQTACFVDEGAASDFIVADRRRPNLIQGSSFYWWPVSPVLCARVMYSVMFSRESRPEESVLTARDFVKCVHPREARNTTHAPATPTR